jgi:hypothetical protein
MVGTRISPDSILFAFRRGDSPETILQNFELLRLEEIYGAIAYYLAHQTDLDEYLLNQARKWTDGKHSAGSLPSNLTERLTRARDEIHSTHPL